MGQRVSLPIGEKVRKSGSGRRAGAATEEMDNHRRQREYDQSPDADSAILTQKSSSLHLASTYREQQQPQVKSYTPNIALPSEFRSSHTEVSREEEGIKTALKSIAPSFTVIHQRLLDLAIGRGFPSQSLAYPIPLTGPLLPEHLRSMMAMAEMEFLASLEKELTDPEEKNASDPVPFDIFLMESSLSRQSNDLRKQLALCVPTRKKIGEQTKNMMWYDGRGMLWDLKPQTHRWKVASLSSTARILEALMHPPTPLMHFAMTREMIVDSSVVSMADNAFYTTNLNDSQQEAVSTVSSKAFTEGIFCVLGPPGTGKTHTITAMIQAVGEGIIVTAPSNAAVANVALKVHSSSYYDLTRIVVFGQNCDESVRFLNPLHRSDSFYKFMKSYNELTDINAKDMKRKEFAHWLKLDPSQDSDISDLAQLCPFIDLEGPSGRKLYAAKLRSASVLFCTLNSAGSNILRNAVHGAFATFILDEAGQCPESEFYIATTFPGIEKMIVVGDPKQLPPTVIDQKCSDLGYGISWLARTYNQIPKKVHLLNVQYRMDKSILEFPNSQFYNKQIMSGDNVVGREPFVSKPILFVDTNGSGREEKNQFSWKNEYEAVAIKSLLYTDEDILKLRSHSPQTRTIIISPYRAQVCLIANQLKKVRGVEVTTVDSVQGNEADIVILSTVRTKQLGFVDDRQRLNVALTRAKRVLRVVGDVSFFLSLRHGDSTLKLLAKFYHQRRLVNLSRVVSIAWTSPDWGRRGIWVPTMTSKFYDSIKKMTAHDKNICFNTVLAVSKPDIKLVIPRPSERARPSWYVSSLKGHSHRLCVVWIAKLRGSDLLIEAHFAGSRDKCNAFIQQHVNLPVGACIVLPDLRGVQRMESSCEDEENMPANLFTSWPLTNPLQNAMMSCSIDSLPQGNLVLDPYQQEIALSSPPLLIESRSGTGKTNVLFQHAVIHTKREQQLFPGCFVTVSQRLCNELRQRYQEMRMIENGDVPEFLFFSRDDILRGLLGNYRINDVNMDNLCSFREYSKERYLKSHTVMVVEERLIENEIGGVILGSLTAGLNKRPLNRYEYLEEKRSNITNKTEHGKAMRLDVFKEFEKYQEWKVQQNLCDINDVILVLLKDPNLGQIFDSAYIDEVQDFSYASLLLICKVGGTKNLNWIFAGDTAQMISPGCSFTFDGLKQVLLSLKAGIESRLSKVSHLLVNYRTTKDILSLGNSILMVAKKNFPAQIAHSLPEVAMKELGLKVRICDFESALSLSVNFGHNQALIYSGDGSDSSRDSIIAFHRWLKDHPFILSSLESKGLEFDDVVIAFSFGRKIWDTTSQSEGSLLMLRELYVAVTRAKRRVVLLIKRKDIAMRNFLGNLGCDIEPISDPKELQVEFDCKTTAASWYQRGVDLFEEGHFGLAASCFAAANTWGLSNWAKGRHLKSLGDRSDAANAYRRAARCFFEELDFSRTLDVLRELSYCPPWDEKDNAIFDKARSEVPNHFDRVETVRLCLVADRWQNIEIRHLKDIDTSTLFVSYKDHPKLQSMIRECSEEERSEISKLLPFIVAEYYHTVQNYQSAVELFLRSNEIALATKSTRAAVDSAKLSDVHVLGCVAAWSQNTQSMRHFSEESYVRLLIRLYQHPLELARTAGKKCLQTFGRRLVIFALKHNSLEMMHLYEFHPTEFRTEVNTNLQSNLSCCLDIVKWYIEKHDYENATEYAKSNWKNIENSELLKIILLNSKIRFEDLEPGKFTEGIETFYILKQVLSYSQDFLPELKRRKLALDAICSVFLPQRLFNNAIEAARLELALPPKHEVTDTDRLKDLVKTKVEQLKNNGGFSFSEIHDSVLFCLLDLCWDPYFAITTFGAKCTKFGKDRILKALSYGGPFSQDPLLFLSIPEKNGIKWNKYDLLKAFYDAGNIESASWYAVLNREKWTNKQVINIVEIMGLPFPIGIELLRRGMASQALPYALNSGDTQTAIKASSEMLKSHVAAEKNILKVLSAWKEKHPDMLQSPEALLKFTRNPRYESYGELTALMMNFGPIVTAFLKIHSFGSNCSENTLNLTTQHHLKLRERIKSCFIEESLGLQNSEVMSEDNLNEESPDDKHLDSTSAPEDKDVVHVVFNPTVVQKCAAPLGKKSKKKNRKNRKKH